MIRILVAAGVIATEIADLSTKAAKPTLKSKRIKQVRTANLTTETIARTATNRKLGRVADGCPLVSSGFPPGPASDHARLRALGYSRLRLVDVRRSFRHKHIFVQPVPWLAPEPQRLGRHLLAYPASLPATSAVHLFIAPDHALLPTDLHQTPEPDRVGLLSGRVE
ncbi:hypothetical protein EN809_032885 [Mesorhizobium sp. M2E.F.Ca.ET.166.01.1.1]|nr:hypothetical protein EN862_032140 [Mesorhizobium sp. M2E.F.Ca.ET.219.01.1.1]TGT65624.1 hypothetical protein EN809_032885 [Mesorhizobium sp. M2E.F.Ca.ET.166.01.1.1]TGV97669.1 hypothetical protein EN797_032895 [Mesorhizobium sp. M2E.F.Ca.ET.154.01.1.1]